MKKEFIENKHYYLNEGGNVVFTSLYLVERGYCCGNNCTHCPYTEPATKGNLEIKEQFLYLKKEIKS